MSQGRDDDALAWEGDDDPTLDVRAKDGRHAKGGAESPAAAEAAPRERRADTGRTSAARREKSAESAPIERDERDAHGDTAPDTEDEPRTLSNVELVALGVLGGVYVFIAMGWIIGGLRLHAVADYLVSGDGAAPATWSAGNLAMVWLAVLAPAIWFATVFLLTRRSAPWLRWVLLLVGMLLLLPWPFIMVGTVGT